MLDDKVRVALHQGERLAAENTGDLEEGRRPRAGAIVTLMGTFRLWFNRRIRIVTGMRLNFSKRGVPRA